MFSTRFTYKHLCLYVSICTDVKTMKGNVHVSTRGREKVEKKTEILICKHTLFLDLK